MQKNVSQWATYTCGTVLDLIFCLGVVQKIINVFFGFPPVGGKILGGENANVWFLLLFEQIWSFGAVILHKVVNQKKIKKLSFTLMRKKYTL